MALRARSGAPAHTHGRPTDGIQKTPYRTWLSQARAAGYNVVWAPLKAEYRAKFNVTAAIAKFQELEGVEYGVNACLCARKSERLRARVAQATTTCCGAG